MKVAFEYLAQGGVIMIPIALGSLIALTIFLERIWSLRTSNIVPKELFDRVMRSVKQKDFKSAREECLRSNTPLGNLLMAGLNARGSKRSEMKGALEEMGKRQVSRMERFIEALGTVASVEPLLGLLGTVIGMIEVFQETVSTSREGAVDPSQLANGIWQALITTAAGLSVAIVAFIGYRYLLSRSNNLTIEMEECANSLIDEIAPLQVSEDDKEGEKDKGSDR